MTRLVFNFFYFIRFFRQFYLLFPSVKRGLKRKQVERNFLYCFLCNFVEICFAYNSVLILFGLLTRWKIA